ncbi:hypothetical protein LWI29_008541 [Acer saccharum]|uniref:Uncharacterized protein n=1 Tax=Acer saccharum TaxID=4024 RepID=A0AA39RRI2_ACESA|nr:hypothetical protein LWI29_008541 [Acer saccharum]
MKLQRSCKSSPVRKRTAYRQRIHDLNYDKVDGTALQRRQNPPVASLSSHHPFGSSSSASSSCCSSTASLRVVVVDGAFDSSSMGKEEMAMTTACAASVMLVKQMQISSVVEVVKMWELWRDGKALEIVDSCINDSCPANEDMRCIQVGLLCVQDNTKDRPSMSNVVFMLSNETILPSPKKSSFPVRNSQPDSSSRNEVFH